MSLRIRAAHWFELMVPRPQLPQALDLLARAGQVELEARPQSGWLPIEVESLRALLDAATQLRRRFAGYWPPPHVARETARSPPAEVRLRAAIERLHAWRGAAETHVATIERLSAERGELQRVADFLQLLGEDHELNFGRLARPGGQMACALLVLTPDTPIPRELTPLLIKQVVTDTLRYALVLGPKAVTAAFADALGGREARLLQLPDWLDGRAAQALAQVRDRAAALAADIDVHRKRIHACNVANGVAAALGELDQLQWLTDHLAALGASEHLVRVTGWTLASTPRELLAPLLAARVAAVAGFSAPPPGYRAPTRSDNPRWARAFELFVRLAGTPGSNEADPSVLVAIIAPLMFGYMFGDIGQGALLIVAGLWARRRWPAAAMLIPGGLLAMAFGWLFGSVFASAHLVAPLWADPIDMPLPVLLLPLAFGAVLIVAGLLLDALSQAWSGRLLDWLRGDAGLLCLYLGAWGLLLERRSGAIVVTLGALWFVLVPLLRDGWRHFPERLGELLERVLQLGINTLSFVRIGAFALAHAGLALAISALAATFATPAAHLVVFVCGNALMLLLEGLVVGVQTTRLLLFEFFIRFVRGEGRPFRPLPPSVSPGSHK